MYHRIRMPLALSPAGSAHEATRRSRIERRAESRQITTIVIISILSLVVILTILYFIVRASLARRKSPKQKRVSFLKQVWGEWRPGGSQSDYEQASADDTTDTASGRRRSGAQGSGALGNNTTTASNNRNQSATVDRNTSIRSIMTLPAYRPKPSTTEQVLGREGERDGVDVVIEFPSAEETENMREEEMEALYQIRLARRQEIAEREERRRQRREARENNDVVALEDIRARARAASNNSLLEELRRDHDRVKNQRQRAVSSVSYGDLGVARLDGTRLRANSSESERVGLLSDAASIAATSTNSRSESSLHHRRERSASSIVSLDSDFPSPGLTRSRSSETRRLSDQRDRAGSSPELIEADLADSDMPPPGYDDVSLDEGRSGDTTPQPLEPPPDYPGPSQQRAATGAADLAVEEPSNDGRRSSDDRRASRGVGGVPQLPSLRLQRLPQIVIEPSSARPGESDR